MSVPGQHDQFYCVGCGTELDNRTVGCQTCMGRHSRRRTRGTKTLPASPDRSPCGLNHIGHARTRTFVHSRLNTNGAA